jgi:hypothetical protein
MKVIVLLFEPVLGIVPLLLALLYGASIFGKCRERKLGPEEMSKHQAGGYQYDPDLSSGVPENG